MYRDNRFAKPKIASLIGAIVIAVLVWAGSHLSSMAGYAVALLSMLMLFVVLLTDSAWPRKSKPENIAVFSLFWGSMLGVVMPQLISIVLDGGLVALYELYVSDP